MIMEEYRFCIAQFGVKSLFLSVASVSIAESLAIVIAETDISFPFFNKFHSLSTNWRSFVWNGCRFV